jgi:hypothetical protein
MQCTQCGLSNPPGTSVCTHCSTPLPFDDATIKDPLRDSDAIRDANQTLTHGWSEPSEPIHRTVSAERLNPGQMLGSRYQIAGIVLLARDLRLLPGGDYDRLAGKTTKVKQMLTGLLQKLKAAR